MVKLKRESYHYSETVEDELYNIPVLHIFTCISTAAFLKGKDSSFSHCSPSNSQHKSGTIPKVLDL